MIWLTFGMDESLKNKMAAAAIKKIDMVGMGVIFFLNSILFIFILK